MIYKKYSNQTLITKNIVSNVCVKHQCINNRLGTNFNLKKYKIGLLA